MKIAKTAVVSLCIMAIAAPGALAKPSASVSAAKAAKAACQTQSKKHVKGEKGTAFSRCIQAANAARKAARVVPAPVVVAPPETAPTV